MTIGQRLRVLAVGITIVLGYFWTGAVAKLWQLTTRSPAGAATSDLRRRPFQGQSLVEVNAGFRELMAVYGPIPIGPLLGPGAASFLRGVGVGLDPSEAEYEERRRRALERCIRTRPVFRGS